METRLLADPGGHAIDDVHVALRARGQFGIVGDHDDGGALAVDFLDQLHHPARHRGIEVAGGLVSQQQARAAGQRTRDGHALLLAAGEFGRVVLEARRQTHALQRRQRALAALAAGHVAVVQRHLDVVQHVEVGDQVEGLEHETDLLVAQARALVVVHAVHVDAIEQVFAAGEILQQPGDGQERGLARARRPGDGDELALVDLEREAAQGVGLDGFGAIHLGHFAHLEHHVLRQ